MISTPPGWIAVDDNAFAYLRSDGVRVEPGSVGGWAVRRTADSDPIEFCPCCDRRFGSARAAMLVADAIIGRDGGDGDATVGG